MHGILVRVLGMGFWIGVILSPGPLAVCMGRKRLSVIAVDEQGLPSASSIFSWPAFYSHFMKENTSYKLRGS